MYYLTYLLNNFGQIFSRILKILNNSPVHEAAFALPTASTVNFGFLDARRSLPDLAGILADDGKAPANDRSRFSRDGTVGAATVPQLSADPRRLSIIRGRVLSRRELARRLDDGCFLGGNEGMM